MLIFHVEDIPDVLSLYAEPFTDDNNNGQWDEGEPYEDINGDSAWTDIATLSDRFGEEWVINVFESGGKTIFASRDWNDPILPDSSLLLELNIQVSPDASPGDVILDLPILLMKANQYENYMVSEGITGIFTIVGDVAVEEYDPSLPREFALYQNYPNPFNPVTTIQYDLPEPSNVRLVIYDLLGHKIKTLINGFQDSGFYYTTWNGTNDSGQPLSTGIYLYRIEAGVFLQTNKLLLLK